MYLSWAEKTLTEFDDTNIENAYNDGFVFTRVGKGAMNQTRSLRIDLEKFELSSENRRILSKTEELNLSAQTIPYTEYDWTIHKMGKEFYETKFGEKTFSAQKIKELITDKEKSNFNRLFVYSFPPVIPTTKEESLSSSLSEDPSSAKASLGMTKPIGYCIALETKNILHYCYPFYQLQNTNHQLPNPGMGMMLKAIVWAKENGKKYVYLGSFQRPTDTYKLQFSGLEWFDGKKWQDDLEELKKTSVKRIHFIGICGVAMSALAAAFHNEGWKVTGSDVGFFPPISDYLKDNNISFYPGWHPEKMVADGVPDIVVVGNVAGSANPEFIYARKNNLNFKSYPEVIAEYIVQKNSAVCVGTYGKTSTTALLTLILEKAGINPSYMFGGLSLNLPYSAKIKLNDNSWSVLEGDEYKTARWDSRPKFKLYSPTHLLLTSVSWDHADIYPTEETYLQAFKDLIGMMPSAGLIVACVDDVKIKGVLTGNINGAKEITYGKDPAADYSYSQVKQTASGISFIIKHAGVEYSIDAPVLGEHMAENICGVFAIAKEINVDEETILKSIAEFKGIKRRLEKRSEGRITIFDDLGHSPAKAAAALKTLRAIYPNNKITAIFEPNTGNRKSQSAPSYTNAFKDASEVIIPLLTKIKIDPNDIDPPFDGKKLTEILSLTQPQTVYIENDDKLLEYVKNNTKKPAKGGSYTEGEDVVVFLGSHGFRGMIEKLAAEN